MNRVFKVLLGCMLLSSFFTHTIDLSSSNLIISRMTISDIFGLFAIALFWFFRFKDRIFFDSIPVQYKLGVFTILTFLITIVTSLSPKSTIFEVLILIYLLLLSFTIYETFKDDFQIFIFLLIVTTFVMSFVGLYDLYAVNNNLGTFFKSASKQHGVSGFRYFAQAGNFSFTMLTLLIPLKYSWFYKGFSFPYRVLLNVTLILTILFMFSSGAVSIIVSFLVGSIIFLYKNYKQRIVSDLIYICGAFLLFVGSIYLFADDLFQNLIFRFKSRVTHRQPETPEASFIIQNIKDTVTSFCDNVFFGSGLGGFVNNYSDFEIHGTYFKVMGETGITGILGYVFFMISFVKFIKSKYNQYFLLFFPFFIASLISWSYNYHFRKKEFWILFSFLMIVNYHSKFNSLKNE